MSTNAIVRRAAAEAQLEELLVERDRALEIGDLERDVIDADESRGHAVRLGDHVPNPPKRPLAPGHHGGKCGGGMIRRGGGADPGGAGSVPPMLNA